MMIDFSTGYLFVSLILLVIILMDYLFLGYAKNRKFFVYWVLSLTTMLISILLLFIPGSPAVVLILIQNPAFLFSMFLLFKGVYLIDHGTRSHWRILIILLGVLTVNIFFYYVLNLFALRVLLISFTVMILFFTSAYQLILSGIHADTRKTRWIRRFMIVSLICYGVIWGIRGFSGLVSAEGSTYFDMELINILTLFLTPSLTISLNSAFLLFLLHSSRERYDLYRTKLVLEENDAVATRLLANLNHELNTPVGNLLGLTSFLMDSEVNSNMLEQMSASLRTNILHVKRIAENRSRILDSGVTAVSEISLFEFIEYVNSIITRDIGSRKTGFKTVSGKGGEVFPCPQKYLFTILATLSDMMISDSTAEGIFSQGIVSLQSIDGALKKYKLTVTARSAENGVCGGLYLDSTEISAYINCSETEIKQKLQWLLYFTSSFFRGRLILDFKTPRSKKAVIFFQVS